jgi:hypothetical protein
MLLSMLLFVTPMRESRPSINDTLGCGHLCKYPSRSGKKVILDFVVGLPRTWPGYDSLWVIVDRLTKVAHFIPVKMTYTRPQLAEL